MWRQRVVVAALVVACGDDKEPVDTEPVVTATASPLSGGDPLQVDFDCSVAGGEEPVDVVWTFGEGSHAPIGKTSFTYTTAGQYVATCIARDADGDQASATVAITVGVANDPPTAAASTLDACAVPTLTVARLDATGSADPEGRPVFYAWMFVAKPPGSLVQLNDAGLVNPSFVPDVPGTYKLRVLVSDQVNITVSSEIVIEAAVASTIAAVSGNAQTATVAQQTPQNVVAVVKNACGTVVPGEAVNWTGTNAIPSDPSDVTAANGTAATAVTLGTTAGAATVTAALVRANAVIAMTTFTFTATPDVPSQLLLDDQSAGVPLSTTPVAASVRVTDRFGNAVSTPNVTFTAQWAGPTTATFATGADCTAGAATITRTTANGVATLPICGTTLETTRLRFTNVTPTTITRTGGRHTFLVDDMETDQPYLTFSDNPASLWKRGTQTFVSGLGAPSGVAVRGTRLDGPVLGTQACFARTALGKSIDLTYPSQVLSAELSFMSYVDLDDNAQCCAAVANLRLDCPGCGAPLLPRNATYDAMGCSGAGFRRTNTAFERIAFDVSAFAQQNRIFAWDVQTPPDVAGAGWYIDDLVVAGTVSEPQIRFVPGAPARVAMQTVIDGCKAPVVRGRLFDAFNNFTNATGTTVSLSATGSATFTSAKVGTSLTGAGTGTATVKSVAGVIEVVLADTAVETSTVAGTVGTSTTPTTVAFTADECTFFADTTENGANGWTHELISSAPGCVADNWALSTARSVIGTTAWHSGPTQACTGDTRLISPSIDLTAATGSIRLAFQQFYAFDDCGDSTFDPDGGIVEVSVDGGPFTQLAGAYSGTLDFVCGNPLQGLPAFTHDTNGAFQESFFDLSAFAGDNIRFAFRVGWDCGNCTVPEGWYIDDIRVEKGSVPSPFAPNRSVAESRMSPYDEDADGFESVEVRQPQTGGGCSTTSGGGLLFALVLLLVRRRRVR